MLAPWMPERSEHGMEASYHLRFPESQKPSREGWSHPHLLQLDSRFHPLLCGCLAHFTLKPLLVTFEVWSIFTEGENCPPFSFQMCLLLRSLWCLLSPLSGTPIHQLDTQSLTSPQAFAWLPYHKTMSTYLAFHFVFLSVRVTTWYGFIFHLLWLSLPSRM